MRLRPHQGRQKKSHGLHGTFSSGVDYPYHNRSSGKGLYIELLLLLYKQVVSYQFKFQKEKNNPALPTPDACGVDIEPASQGSNPTSSQHFVGKKTHVQLRMLAHITGHIALLPIYVPQKLRLGLGRFVGVVIALIYQL